MTGAQKQIPAPRANAGSRENQSFDRRQYSTSRKELKSLANKLHACGPRAIFEFLADLARGRDFADSVADFARLDPDRYRALIARLGKGGAA